MGKVPTEEDSLNAWTASQPKSVWMEISCRICGGTGAELTKHWEEKDILIETHRETIGEDKWEDWIQSDVGRSWLMEWLKMPLGQDYQKDHPCPTCNGKRTETVQIPWAFFIDIVIDSMKRRVDKAIKTQ